MSGQTNQKEALIFTIDCIDHESAQECKRWFKPTTIIFDEDRTITIRLEKEEESYKFPFKDSVTKENFADRYIRTGDFTIYHNKKEIIATGLLYNPKTQQPKEHFFKYELEKYTIKNYDDLTRTGKFSLFLSDIFSKASTSTKGKMIGAAVGTIAGATIGAIIGSSILPGVGTVIGLGVGGIIGTAIGTAIGRTVAHLMFKTSILKDAIRDFKAENREKKSALSKNIQELQNPLKVQDKTKEKIAEKYIKDQTQQHSSKKVLGKKNK